MLKTLLKSYKQSKALKILGLFLILTIVWLGGYRFGTRANTATPPVSYRIFPANANTGDIPADLKAFLQADLSNSDKQRFCGPSYSSYQVVGFNERFAKVIQQCGGAGGGQALVLKKQNGNWSFAYFNGISSPFDLLDCRYINGNKVSKDVEPYCLSFQGNANGPDDYKNIKNLKLETVTNP